MLAQRMTSARRMLGLIDDDSTPLTCYMQLA